MLTFSLIDRMPELVSVYRSKRPIIGRQFTHLLKTAQQIPDKEEQLYFIFLVTHFDMIKTAHDFHRRLSWQQLLGASSQEIRTVCANFFAISREVGGHRSGHFRLKKDSNARTAYTVDVLESYKECVATFGSQGAFFEVDGEPVFHHLYERISAIRSFHTRLPRFDHLERITKSYDFFIGEPQTLYLDRKDASGPLSGLTYHFFGIRYTKINGEERREFKAYLLGPFKRRWNRAAGGEWKLHDEATLTEILSRLEHWLIGNAKTYLLPSEADEAYVYDLETCLCEWQKGK